MKMMLILCWVKPARESGWLGRILDQVHLVPFEPPGIEPGIQDAGWLVKVVFFPIKNPSSEWLLVCRGHSGVVESNRVGSG